MMKRSYRAIPLLLSFRRLRLDWSRPQRYWSPVLETHLNLSSRIEAPDRRAGLELASRYLMADDALVPRAVVALLAYQCNSFRSLPRL